MTRSLALRERNRDAAPILPGSMLAALAAGVAALWRLSVML